MYLLLKGVNMKKIILIDGMKCENCANRIKMSLEKIDNILNVNVNLDTKEVVIEYDKEINNYLIEEVINDLGFIFMGEK